MNWYYVSAGKQTGPVDDGQLEALARSGQVQMDTLVWREGMAEWQPYSTVAPPGTAAPGPAPTASGPASAAPVGASQVVCAECRRVFPSDETIPVGTVRVCATCKPIFLQKLAEGATIGGQLRYATLLTRFGAVFLDGLMLQVVNFGIGLLIGLSVAQLAGVEPSEKVAAQLISTVLGILIAASYEIFMIGKYGATLGKMAAKVRVVNADGAKISYGRSTGRYFAKILSSLVCGIGFIMAFFDDERRALHDRICNTRVITIA